MPISQCKEAYTMHKEAKEENVTIYSNNNICAGGEEGSLIYM